MSFKLNRYVLGDCRETLHSVPSNLFSCCITSPPYWRQRDYGHPEQIGLEPTYPEYIAQLIAVFREIRRVLRPDGTLWLNLGDSSAASGCGGGGRFMKERGKGAWAARAQLKGFHKLPEGLKRKDIVGIPWRVAFALQDDGWYLRPEIIWAKPNPQPESVKDRPTKSHEYVFLLAKSEHYYYNGDAIREPTTGNAHSRGRGLNPKARAHAAGSKQNASFSAAIAGNHDAEDRNARSVWTIPTESYHGKHYAPFPRALARRCMLAGSPEGGAVIDPFFGSGTVGRVAEDLGRLWFGCELTPEYEPLIAERTAQTGMKFAGGDEP